MVRIETLKCNTWKYISGLFAILLIISTGGKQQRRLIYILQWTNKSHHPWIYWDLEMGQDAFSSRNCSFQNCFITPERTFFDSVLDFDVLLFNTVNSRLGDYKYDLPLNRSDDQLYVFIGREPTKHYKIPVLFNDFFNLTWTYKLASDIVHPYFVVKNKFGNIIGPKINMQWMFISYLAPKNLSVEQKLGSKRIAAAFVASDCMSDRHIFIDNLKGELLKYGHQIDIYGQCGNLSCPRLPTERNGLLTNCYSKIESDYYFYLAFEKSITKDYVTEQVLHGLLHFAVPIVYGGADYTRFLPNGTYLNAIKLGVKNLGKEMNDIINDPQRYYEFFKWHDYYSFHDTAEDGNRLSVCAFCAFLNEKARIYKRTIYTNIVHWWKHPITDDTTHVDSFPNSYLYKKSVTTNV